MSSHRLLDIEFNERLDRERDREREKQVSQERTAPPRPREISVSDTAITLPSGASLKITNGNFTPTREFWKYWHKSKISCKRNGVFITRDAKGKYHGKIRTAGSFSYSEDELFDYWHEQAERRAETDPCDAVYIEKREMTPDMKPPCICWRNTHFRLDAKWSPHSGQVFLLCCERCGHRKIIDWQQLKSFLIIAALAHAIQNRTETIGYADQR